MTKPLSTLATVRKLKDHTQDFEWYPTTQAMLETIRAHIETDKRKDRHPSNMDKEVAVDVLDCGAGDGRALMALAGNGNKYAIEKSAVLMGQQPREIVPVGTDFQQATLIDKKVDVVFSNPPYSEFEAWAVRIIREANAQAVYLVIPQRWENSVSIKNAMQARKAEAEILYTGDFLQADRQARAKVHVLHISLIKKSRIESHYYRYDGPEVDPFDLWFDTTFPKAEPDPEDEAESRKEALKGRFSKEILLGKNLIEALVHLHQKDMAKLQHNYAAAASLDPELLRELEINHDNLKKAIKERIKGLKHLYWHEFFNNYASITDRLTTGSRKRLLEKLHGNTAVDFTAENAYAITLWVIKNANHYYDDQLIEVVERMTKQANIHLYKSNQRVIRDEEWRHGYGRRSDIPESLDRYQLEYRIVLEHMGGISTSQWSFERERNGGLSETAGDFVMDIIAVAKTLGWNCQDTTRTRGHFPRAWESNKLQEFRCNNAELLMDVRAFKKGTIHIRFAQDFIKKLNVEFGRLKGWLKDKHQAAQETGITPEEAAQFFGSNLQLGVNAGILLLTQDVGGNADLPTETETAPATTFTFAVETFSWEEAKRMGCTHEDAIGDEEFEELELLAA
ncbi:MAG: hypothetical protein BWK73_10465 [Thiothrix lacustris]|uniref:DUF4942 domain-containing protein n=1 Tax=Thiothrix lacustris TaxID=525917 RepID=A0A1Y1QUD7_9GAMM|nr:MAG: hypothetical protein BWK73_10465 [Thiothrix lacustris]